MSNRDWTVHPGATLREWREEQGLWPAKLAERCSMDLTRYERLEAGKIRITDVVAAKLQQGTGISAEFWLKYERQFRADLAAGKRWEP